MATAKPRITVTLTKQQYDVLRAISEYGGESMSNFIGDLLEQSLPVLERMAEAFRKIRQVQDEQKKRISEELTDAQNTIEPVFENMIGQFDLFMSRLEGSYGVGNIIVAEGASPDVGAEGASPDVGDAPKEKEEKKPRKRTPKKVGAEGRPPLTNRGVTPPPKTPQKTTSKSNKSNGVKAKPGGGRKEKKLEG